MKKIYRTDRGVVTSEEVEGETMTGLCDVWWHEKNEAGESMKVCCPPRVETNRLYDEQSYLDSTCDKDEVKVGDDWMGFTISRIEPIERCRSCETNSRTDKRPNGTCDECQGQAARAQI
jgi:hypothetical protein